MCFRLVKKSEHEIVIQAFTKTELLLNDSQEKQQAKCEVLCQN